MRRILLTFLIAAISITTAQAKRTKIKITEYAVELGDTLFTIARKHRTTTEEVRKSNSLEKGQLIRVGQLLRVPTNTYFPKTDQKSTAKKRYTHSKKSKKGKLNYTIAKGDTLFIIARKHHTTTQELRDANSMERNTLIHVGQVITVPTDTYFPGKQSSRQVSARKTPKKGKVSYTIEKGDTLFTIAHKHHTTIKELREANGMEYNALIHIGQILKVPTNTYFPEDVTKETNIVVKNKKKRASKGIYEVCAGDTLFSVAKKNHMTLREIMSFNEIKAGSVIRVGQKLKVSKKNAFFAPKKRKVSPTTTPNQYKTKRGDTLFKVAKKYKISIKKLRALNARLRKVKNVHSKLKVNIPLTVVAVSKKFKTYRVKKGDTLWLIAKKHKTTIKRLRALNKLSKRSKLYRGMVLAVDVGERVSDLRKRHITKNRKRARSKKSRKGSRNRRLSNAMALLNGKRGGGNSHIIRTAKRYLGRRYVWGAEGPNRFDCSGFTQYVIRKSKGVKLPRVSRKQAYYGKYVSRRNLRSGDLVFFDTSRRRRGYINHVGIYIGSNKFIHASSAKHRVVISSLSRPFYNARFKWGRRVN